MDLPTYTPTDAPVPEGEVVIERSSTPQELGPKLNRTAADVVRFLMQLGEMVTATQSLSDEQIELFAEQFGATVRLVDPGEEQEVELQKVLGYDDLLGDGVDEGAEPRPPIITVMGHVDHGKTKLLDRIRDTNVVAGEAGGITQAIGAYQAVKNDRLITFIDTPGHEAFTAMRARGAEATDIVVLVVAADDGVMPQTIEALNHAKASGAPIVVAINKIDREQAQPDRVKQQLSEQGLVPQDWGGDTEMIPVSALNGDGVDDLLETLLLVADVEDLKASAEGRAAGVVLESHLDIGRGPVATLLVQRGTLKVGEPLVAGPAWGRVRALIDHRGENVTEAGPSMPVQVLGLNDVADAGDSFVVAQDERTAKSVAEKREHWHRVANLGREAAAPTGARLEDIFEQIQRGDVATLNILLKADTTGSLEALTESLRKLERDEVKLSFVHRAVGGITQQDVQLAATSGATIIGFNVRPDRKARELAQVEEVEIRNYEIIYQVLEDIENAMVGMLAPEFEEVVTGEAEVREVFSVPRVGKVAGCMVLSGTITRGSKVRFLREGTIIWKGAVSSLRRFKDDVREVQSGFECGIGLTDFQDLKQGDIIETYEEREIPRS
jgi:translation initiation factor IF-2